MIMINVVIASPNGFDDDDDWYDKTGPWKCQWNSFCCDDGGGYESDGDDDHDDDDDE